MMTFPVLEATSAEATLYPGPIWDVSIVIPTYQRERVLVETIDYLLTLQPAPAEILIVDQTGEHEPATQRALAELEGEKRIRWIRLPRPSITHAMNVGLEAANTDIVLFLDDDIIPSADLISAHTRAHATRGRNVIAGQVLQPGEESMSEEQSTKGFTFRSNRGQFITELMGGNFSVKRKLALELGGFDENFVHVAYRFEAEFAARSLAAGEKIWFEPEASIRHLKADSGGTRYYGDHLKTIRPSHSVGAYYYLLRSRETPNRLLRILTRPIRAIRTKHHLSHPWWIPPTLVAETAGFFWAVGLALRGPRLVKEQKSEVRSQRSDADC
jgi:GT2 family glycosyltransferase